MRRLLYVPIIHSEPDLGSLAEGIEARAKTVVGSSNWQKHKEVVSRYWQAIAAYWEGKNVAGFKIYQDGMPVAGPVGKNIVKSLAAQGSINYQIIDRLMERGAELIQTEDPELLKEEYALTIELLKRESLPGSLSTLSRHRWQKDRLLQARDAYVSKRINESLKEAETGICFLGASHQILPHLSKDIEVIALKDPQKVRIYAQMLTSAKWKHEVEELGAYLAVPIKLERGNSDDE